MFLLPDKCGASNKMNKTTVTTKNVVFLSFNANSLFNRLEELQNIISTFKLLFSSASQNLGAILLNQTACMQYKITPCSTEIGKKNLARKCSNLRALITGRKLGETVRHRKRK